MTGVHEGFFVWIPKGKRPLGRPRRRWENNIIVFSGSGMWGVDWIELAQDRDRLRAGTCNCGNEPSGSVKCREFLD